MSDSYKSMRGDKAMGFDCMGHMDAIPLITMIERSYQCKYPDSVSDVNGKLKYRDVNYVIHEVKKMIDQVLELEKMYGDK